MTRKDFELIAIAMKSVKPYNAMYYDAWRNAVVALCEPLRASNPRFDSYKFLKACGLKEEDFQ